MSQTPSAPTSWKPVPYSSNHLRITSTRVVYYSVWQGERKRSKMPKLNKAESLSKKSAQRIRDYITLLVDTATWKTVYHRDTNMYYRFKINMITLTLPSEQCHTDNEIHEKCFKTFIRFVKRRSPGFMYVYKAEVQDNGNLHYHLTTNTYIDHKVLRNDWNYYINKLGYVKRSSTSNPNSTDVHSVKNIDNIADYMVKYMSKKDLYTSSLARWHKMYKKILSNREAEICKLPNNYFKHIKRRVTIKVWDCSKTLKIGKCVVNEPNEQMYDDIMTMLNMGAENIPIDYAVYWKINRKMLNNTISLKKHYDQFCKNIRAENLKVKHDIVI